MKQRWIDCHFQALGDDPWTQVFREVVFGLNDAILLGTCVIIGATAVSAFTSVGPTLVRGVVVVVMLASSLGLAARQWLCKLLDNELEREEMQTELRHLEKYPDEEDSEILASWDRFGLSQETLEAMKRDMRGGGGVRRLRLHAKYELKIDPDRWLDSRTGELTGSVVPPLWPVVVSALTNMLGIAIPILPWLALADYLGMVVLTLLTLTLSGGSLFTFAYLLKDLSGGYLRSCMRQAVNVSATLLLSTVGVLVAIALLAEFGIVRQRYGE